MKSPAVNNVMNSTGNCEIKKRLFAEDGTQIVVENLDEHNEDTLSLPEIDKNLDD